MLESLNHFLADLVVEYHKLQNFHWYVAGMDFFAAHSKLAEYYIYIGVAIDEVAENILILNGRPYASLRAFIEHASISEADAAFVPSKIIWNVVLEDFTSLLEQAKQIKKAADTEDVSMISSSMDEYIHFFSKAIWMLMQQAQYMS